MSERYSKVLENRVRPYLEKLVDTGLSVEADTTSRNSIDKAAHYVARVGPERFETYFRSLQKHSMDGPETPISVDDVLKIYKFDRRLRLLTLDALERIEVTTKALICSEMTEHFGSDWLGRKNTGVPYKLRSEIVSNIIRVIRIRSGEDQTFNEVARKGDQGLIADAMSFGQMSKMLSHLTDDGQTLISGAFRSNPKAFNSWLRTLTHVRNDCAHHMTLWDKRYVTRPRITGNITRQFGEVIPPEDYNAHYFGHATLIYYLVQRVARNTRWHQRLYDLLNARDVIPNDINVLGVMKFPPEWHRMPFWREASGSAT